MAGIMIAQQDPATRRQVTALFQDRGYRVHVAHSIFEILYLISAGRAAVALVGIEFDQLLATELIPLLKRFDPDLTVILLSDEESLPLLRRIRGEGIFYHALTPLDEEGARELRLAVDCALGRPGAQVSSRTLRSWKARIAPAAERRSR